MPLSPALQTPNRHRPSRLPMSLARKLSNWRLKHGAGHHHLTDSTSRTIPDTSSPASSLTTSPTFNRPCHRTSHSRRNRAVRSQLQQHPSTLSAHIHSSATLIHHTTTMLDTPGRPWRLPVAAKVEVEAKAKVKVKVKVKARCRRRRAYLLACCITKRRTSYGKYRRIGLRHCPWPISRRWRRPSLRLLER